MATYEIKSPDGQTWEVNAPDSASEAEVMAYAQSQWTPTMPAGGGRGYVNPPDAADVKGNILRQAASPDATTVDKAQAAQSWVGERIKELQQINPQASLDDLAGMAGDEYKRAVDAPVAAPTDRVRQYLDKGYTTDDAKANAEFDTGVQNRINLRAMQRPADERGDRVIQGYNPNTESERVARESEELAGLRDDALGRIASGEMNPVLRGAVKGGVQSVGLTAATIGYLADVVGADTVKQWGLDTNNAASKIANQMTLAKTASQITNVDDFQGWLAENGGYVAYQAAEALLAGGLAAGLSKQAARQAAIEATTLGMNNLRQTLGSVYADAVDEGKRTGKDPSLFGVALGALGSAVVDTAADKFGLDAISRAGFKGATLSRMAKSVGLQGAVQGGTEALQLVPEEMGAGRDPFRDGMGAQYFDEAAVGALGGGGPGVLGGLKAKGELSVEDALIRAIETGQTVKPIVAPRVEDMPTTPVVPQVQPRTNQAAQNVVENIAGLLGEQAPTIDAGTAPTVEAPTVQPPEPGVPGQADATATESVPNTVQPAADGAAPIPAAASLSNPAGDVPAIPTATSLSNPVGDVPTAADPRQAALAQVEAGLQAAKARQEAEAQTQAATAQAEQEKAAAADLAKRSVGSAYQQTSATPTAQPGAVPAIPENTGLRAPSDVPVGYAPPTAAVQPMTEDRDGNPVPRVVPPTALEQGMVKMAMSRWSKNQDLTDDKTYPETVLYGIINSPDVGPELLGAARQELGRRRGTNTQPTVSTSATFSGTTSLGVGGQPAGAAGGVNSVAGQPGPVDPGVVQAGGSQPILSSRATAAGSAAPNGSTRALAPTAPDALLAQVSEQLRKDRGVTFTPYKGPLTTGQQVASAFANANGRTFTVVDRTAGRQLDMPNGFAIPGTKHVVVDRQASDAPVLVAVHEVYHLLPTKLRLKANKALRALFQEHKTEEFAREFSVTPEQFEEEIPAYMAQAVASRPTFWQELRDKMGNKDFSEFAGFVLQKFKDLMRGAEAKLGEGFLQKYIGEESKILEAQRILSDLYVESMREQGMAPDQAVVAAPMPSNKPVDAQEEQRQYKLDVDRADRTTGVKASVSKAEVDAITAAAQKLGLDAKQVAALVESARETRKRFPPKAGWAPIEATGVEAKKDDDGNVKYDKKGNPQVAVTWKPIAYGFNVPPGKARAPAAMDTGLVGKVADQFTKLVQGIYARAESGDKNAQIIVGHQTWYRNVAEILRSEFGGQGDLFADLLGATSPNTPVDTNWRFAVEILTRFAKGEFDGEMEAFNKWVSEGGQPSKFPGEKIRQASGKLYGMNSKNSMLALADLWRAVEAGTAPKARNFALNLIGQSNMATIDVWAARMLRRAANNVRGMDLPRIPTVAEQGVTGNWNAGTTAVTGEFGFGAAVLDKVSADLAKKGIELSPPDLQALAWFAEKELWTEKNWTSAQGEGGSFEENIEATPTNRYLAGWSIQQGEKAPDPTAVSAAQARVLAMLTGDPSVVAARVLPTYGLYGGVVEQSFDTEWTVAKGQHDPSMVLAEIAKLASENGQYDMFVSRVVGPKENNPNARPGVEIYFKSKRDLQAAMPVLKEFTSRGQDGFTMAVDPRAKGGENFIGVRLQYVPEISMRWDEGLREELMAPGGIEKALAEKELALRMIAADVSKMEGVAHAAAQRYDTVVVGKENYDEYIDGVTGAGYSETGSKSWFGQPVRQGLEGAVARYEGERREDGAGSLPGAGSAIPFSNKSSDGLGGVHAERGPGARAHAVRVNGTHFSQNQRSSLDGRYFGRGLKGAEQSRLAEATDPRIKERVYFYVDEGKGVTPEAGVGGYAHAASVDNLYNVQGDPLKLFKAGDTNGSESRVLDAGFDGYYFPNYVNGQGIAIVLGNASRGIKVQPTEYAKGMAPATPAQPYKRGLSSKELNTIDMAAVQEAAPSAKLRAGTFQVDEAELDAARAELTKQGINLPPGPVFSNKAQDLDRDIELTIPLEGGKTAKLTVNAQAYIKQLDAREEALKMVKECMA